MTSARGWWLVAARGRGRAAWPPIPALGLALDELLGDPRRMHPVAGFGAIAAACERGAYRRSRAVGAAYATLLVALPTAATVAVRRALGPRGAAALDVAAVAVCVGGRSLRRTAVALAERVEVGDLDGARALAPALVSRDPQALDADGLARAALESLAENTADAVVAPLLWSAVAGAPGAVAHRAANTLDAMVGYRSERYREFGWAAARLDDALNWPAARLTAAAAVVAAPLSGGSPRCALRAWRRDGSKHPSPNAGRVEAAFAGALGVRLGGPTRYGATLEPRAQLGEGRPPTPADVRRAARLSRHVAWLTATALGSRATCR